LHEGQAGEVKVVDIGLREEGVGIRGQKRAGLAGADELAVLAFTFDVNKSAGPEAHFLGIEFDDDVLAPAVIPAFVPGCPSGRPETPVPGSDRT